MANTSALPLVTFNKEDIMNSTESSTINSTHLDDESNVNTAAVYRASDFAAMAIVFAVVLVLSVLWQKRFPPFCMFQKSQGKGEETFEDTTNISSAFQGIEKFKQF